jgi:sugar phosphate isomerase/epimerase
MSEDTGFEDAVAKYVVLRSEMRDMEEAHKAAMAELQAEQEEYTAIILATCNQLGADSLRTAAGTVTRKVVSRYWTSDWGSMYEFIKERDAPFLLEQRIHNGNMRQFLADNPDRMPAGLQSDSRYTIQVRKPTNK